MINNILSAFPSKFTPSSQQVKLLKKIEKAFNDGHKFVVCNAPTGSGKSFISKTIGNLSNECPDKYKSRVLDYTAYNRAQYGNYQYEDELTDHDPFGCFTLTITKSLQDQYKEQFSDIEILKGKSNYICDVDDQFTVDIAPCLYLQFLKKECWKTDRCPYYKQRNNTLTSKFATLNYNMFFSLPEHLKHREYIICDEASELEDQLVKEFTCIVEFNFLKYCDIKIKPYNRKSPITWVRNLIVLISDKINNIRDTIATNEKKYTNEKKTKERDKLVRLQLLGSKLAILNDTWNDSEYICEPDQSCVIFTPLKVDQLSNRLFKYGKKIILMSATIIDSKNFCKSLGIKDFVYIEAESTFDHKKAPIFCSTKIKLNHYNLEKNLPIITQMVESICALHKNEKGLIHTQTHKITKHLMNNLKDDRFLFREHGVSNESIIQSHVETDQPTVLISPSLTHGVDLKDNLARFQIIIKAPYLPIKSKRVESLMKLDRDWYINKMLGVLIQACGRGIRSKDDYCKTYILDSGVVEAVLTHKQKLPKYFIDRFI